MHSYMASEGSLGTSSKLAYVASNTTGKRGKLHVVYPKVPA